MFQRGRCRLRALIVLIVTLAFAGSMTMPSAVAATPDPTALTISCPAKWPVYSPDEVSCTFTVVDTAHSSSIPMGGVSDESHGLLIPLDSKGHGATGLANDDTFRYDGDSTHAPSPWVTVTGFENRSTALALYCPKSWPAGLSLSCLAVLSDTSPASGDVGLGPDNTVTVTDDDGPAVSASCALANVIGPESCQVHFHAEANPGTTHHLHATVAIPYYNSFVTPPDETSTTMDVGPLGSGELTPVVAGLSATPLYYGQTPVTLTLQPPAGQPAPTGVIDVFDNGQKLYGDYLDSSGVLTMAATRLHVGDHTLSFDYRGDTNYAHQSFGPFGVHVTAVGTRVTLRRSTATATTHQPVTFTTAVATTVGTAAAQGYVVFYRDGKPYAERTVDRGTASWTTVFAKGVHHVTAHYVGLAEDGSSADLASSVSPATSVTVTPLAAGAPRPVGTFYGSTAPNIGGTDQFGNTVDLKSQRGKWVLLVFDALWCPAGTDQAQQLESLTRHMKAAHVPFTALTMAFQKTQDGAPLGRYDAEQFARGNGSTSPVVAARDQRTEVTVGRMAAAYADATVEEGIGVPGVPEPGFAVPVDVVIDPQGVVQLIAEGRLDLDQIQSELHPSYQLPPVVNAPRDDDPQLPAASIEQSIAQLPGMHELPAHARGVLSSLFRSVEHRMDPVNPQHGLLAAAFAKARSTIVADRAAHQLTAHDAAQLRYDLDYVADVLNAQGAGIAPHHRGLVRPGA